MLTTESIGIATLNERIARGRIRIPEFQRGFVWDSDRVAHFLDTIWKSYPFGQVLIWRTNQRLARERRLGPFDLPEPDEELPLDYVLDGQQRLTSLFATFQNELTAASDAEPWPNIYLDLNLGDLSAQKSVFAALDEEVDPERWFPVRSFFDVIEFRRATGDLDPETLLLVESVNDRFKQAQLPVQYYREDDPVKVATVFERVNRLGVELDTFQLLGAWTWNDDFDLISRFENLREDLEEHGFGDVADNTSLMLRCAAGILTGDQAATGLIELDGADIRAGFTEVENGIKGAIDYLRTEARVESLKLLPYPAILIPLSRFFASDGGDVSISDYQQAQLKRWFWRTSLAARYRGQRAVAADLPRMVALAAGDESSVGDVRVSFDSSFFTTNQFRTNNSASRAFVLLLSTLDPRNLISGSAIELDKVLLAYNRREFHHLFPRAHLRESEVPGDRANSLANICILVASENRQIGSRPPAEYASEMPADATERADVEARAALPQGWDAMEYDEFLAARSQLLSDHARALMGLDGER